MEEENRVAAEHFWVYIGVEAKLLFKWGVLLSKKGVLLQFSGQYGPVRAKKGLFCSNIVQMW